MIVMDATVVDTNTGSGGALRVVISCEQHGPRTVIFDLRDLYDAGLDGRVAHGTLHIMDDLQPTGKVVQALG